MLSNTKPPVTHRIYRSNLKQKVSASQKIIRENITAANAKIIHRTQAKNRGYRYKHAFFYNWNAMKCFHILMRHAINAISIFIKILSNT